MSTLSGRKDLVFQSTKTYNHSVGLSCAFRQWRADSHCKYLHGYALKVNLLFEATELDARNWVVDFGSLKSLKGWLEDTFDHKTLVAEDDPEYGMFRALHERGVIVMRSVPHTGMERVAEMIYEFTEGWLKDNGYSPRVILRTVEVAEHEGNSAIVFTTVAS